ncbi:MAG: hypothetical protein J0L87_00335 [Bacteroidetes bacterium]|nr:hypothetical protein [Bacteroidota bacterium]
MKEILNRYCSIALLFLFLFPLVEKEMHTLEHMDDFHCTSSDKHFHEQEHSCSLCDYSVPDSNELEIAYYQFRSFGKIISFDLFTSSVHSPSSYQDIPSRAPPVV